MIVRIVNLWGIWPLTKLPRERKKVRERIVSVNIDIAVCKRKAFKGESRQILVPTAPVYIMYESLIVNDEDAMRVKGGIAGDMRECQSKCTQHKSRKQDGYGAFKYYSERDLSQASDDIGLPQSPQMARETLQSWAA